MKIGIITSGTDIALLQGLQSGSWTILIDPLLDTYKLYYPEYRHRAIQHYIGYLGSQGIDTIIVSPWDEFHLSHRSEIVSQTSATSQIIPLFHRYLTEHILRYTLVGKLGFRGDQADLAMINQRIKILRADFKPSDRQTQISRFHHDLPIWTVFAGLQKDLITGGYQRSRVLNNIVKYDLHRLKDADIDTLVPLQYCYRHASKQLKHYFNTRKRRFHDLSVLQAILTSYTDTTSPYQAQLVTTVALDQMSAGSSYRKTISKATDLQTVLIPSFFCPSGG